MAARRHTAKRRRCYRPGVCAPGYRPALRRWLLFSWCSVALVTLHHTLKCVQVLCRAGIVFSARKSAPVVCSPTGALLFSLLVFCDLLQRVTHIKRR